MTASQASRAASGGEQGLAGKAATSAAWTMTQQWAVRIFGFLTVAVLARLLTPEDFGLVALAGSLLPLVHTLADLGFSTYLVQAADPRPRTFRTAFWYAAAVGLALSAALALAAPAIAAVLQEPAAADVIRALAPAAFIVSLNAVPMAILRRELRFRAIAIQSVAAGVAGQAVAIVLAFAGWGVWALVWQTLVYQVIVMVMAWTAARWRPGLGFSWREFREMLHFGSKVIAADLVGQGRVWLENAIVLLFLGVQGLGYLNVAQRLVTIAYELTANAVQPVSVVLFARIRDAADRLAAGYIRVQGVAHALVVPVMVGIAVSGAHLFPLVFGEQWDASVVPGAIYAVAGAFALSGMDRGLLSGVGRPGVWLAYVVVVDAVTVVTTWFVAPHGLAAVATGFLAVAIAATATRWIIVSRVLGIPWWTAASPLARTLPAVAAALAAGVPIALLCDDLPHPAAVGLIALGMIAAYLPVARWTMPAVFGELQGLVARVTGRLVTRRRPAPSDPAPSPVDGTS
ncbi:lipopolysaccharide biosynthesis protein [Microbacterium sp. Marseille-Q6965]|uniref:lipopolysaccharide biosynthesis protein n=1 Tax=Microbacterium sp. Marseille-Q6965 TaxID=2965072 RepID=UPI0021B719D6|nr:lipopolysaccharide biosynthesis protein [Microbacterium sp. Marseille-Q6965]